MYCAIIPARSGSKRIPKKNLLKFEGETLVERAVKCGGAVDRVIVATEFGRNHRVNWRVGRDLFAI